MGKTPGQRGDPKTIAGGTRSETKKEEKGACGPDPVRVITSYELPMKLRGHND